MATAGSKGRGTVVPNPSFNADQGAADLRKAMKGLGTDEAAIIKVMSSHSNEQRRAIEKAFKTAYGKDLKAELKSEISGKFENVVLALLEPPRLYDAQEIKKAIKGAGTDEQALIEILCSKSNAEIAEIKALYKTTFKDDLEKDVSSDTSGHFKRLLVSQISANRDESGTVNPATSQQDCKDLFEAGANKIGTDESTFNRILCLRNWAQLCASFDEYAKQHGKDIESVIKSETSGYLEEGYLALVKLARSKPAFFAERLYKSMKGAGTKDDALIRIIVSRCEVDMVEIKAAFQQMYGKSLASFISGDTSGDYKKTLLALIGEPTK